MRTRKKTVIITIAVITLFLMAFGDKVRDKPKIIEKRRFSSSLLAGENMLRVRVSGRVFDVDVYEYPNRAGETPAGYMTYESAKTACERAGKRLCTNEEWTDACRGPSLGEYSYGDRFSGGFCNSIHQERRVAKSGDFADCRSETGLHDMAGNLWEWVERSKTGALPAKGGSYRDGELAQRCTMTFKLFPSQTSNLSFDNFGTRCCRDAPPAEEKAVSSR